MKVLGIFTINQSARLARAKVAGGKLVELFSCGFDFRGVVVLLWGR